MNLKMLLARTVAATVLATPLSLSGQAVAKMDDEAIPTKPFARFSASVNNIRDSIVAIARRQLGTPYRLGTKAPGRSFDCSGLVQYVMEHFNIELPRTSREQAKIGVPVARDTSALRPGDLLTFGKGKTISHIGIYIGDGKYVHAASKGGKVKEASLSPKGTWWKGARRVIATSASTDSSSKKSAAN
jgi:cell wall-associated NlpC family hydrolase